MTLETFRLAQPLALLLLLWLIFWYRRQHNTPPSVISYSDTRILSGLPLSYRLRLRKLPNATRLLAWSFLVLALARPQLGSEIITLYGNGIDIVFAIDISDSMGTRDFDGLTRLEATKLVIEQFTQERPNNRFGVVVFAEESFYLSPPTLDNQFIRQILRTIQQATDLGLSNRSAIGVGIASSSNMLLKSDAQSKVVILLTDGENNAGVIDPIIAAQASKTLGIRVYTVGIGQARQDDESLSGFDEQLLREVAFMGNGAYYNALDSRDLTVIYQAIDALESRRIDRTLNVLWQDQAFIVLWIALILLILERVLRHTIFQTLP